MKKAAVILLAALLALLCGCGEKELPADAYVEGSDYQYMQSAENGVAPSVQRGEAGVYFRRDHFIYYLEYGGDDILPLCSKADCLHDKEPDPKRLEECSAYAGDRVVGLAYCNGYLYCLASSYSNETTLYRYTADGAKRDVLYQWQARAINDFIVHRDVAYFVDGSTIISDDGPTNLYQVIALPLKAAIPQPEVIFEPDEDLHVYSVQYLKAYGNHLYFNMVAVREEPEEMVSGTYHYQIAEKKLEKLVIPELPDMDCEGVTFWNGRLILNLWGKDNSDDYERLRTVYTTGLDGSDPQVLLEDIPQGYGFLSDGKYLYMTNRALETNGYSGVKTFYKVFDSEMNEVDTFQWPWNGYFPPGAPETLYWPFASSEDESVFGLMVWDKSKLGSYHGGVVDKDTDIRMFYR